MSAHKIVSLSLTCMAHSNNEKKITEHTIKTKFPQLLQCFEPTNIQPIHFLPLLQDQGVAAVALLKTKKVTSRFFQTSRQHKLSIFQMHRV